MWNTRRLGEFGEKIAETFLTLKGFEILEKNFRYAGREIDLLAREGAFLVAVEVKLRRGNRFGRAVEAVDIRKLARIEAALCGAQGRFKRLTPRIDLVVIDLDDGLDEMVVTHMVAVS